MDRDSKIYIAGHQGLAGSSLLVVLKKNGFKNFCLKTHEELDLTQQESTRNFFEKEKPDYVFVAAAKVGGIRANHLFPGDFIYQNLAIQTNLLHAAFQAQVKRLIFLGSSCIYPQERFEPMKEESLLKGSLESTNESYAVAKIAGIKMCQAYNQQYGTQFVTLMPANIYGPHDNFDLQTSHVIPAMIRKFDEAKMKGLKSVTFWGTGLCRREFLYVSDLAAACQFVMSLDESDWKKVVSKYQGLLNVGFGEDISIVDLSQTIARKMGYEGEIFWDTTFPDGPRQNILENSKLFELGWRPQVSLDEGLSKVIHYYRDTISKN